MALINFPKGRGGTFDKEVPYLFCTCTFQDEVQRTLALGGAKGEDDPIIVAACDVRDLIDVNDVVFKTNEIHWATSMTQYGQSKMRPIRVTTAAGRGAHSTVAPAFALLPRGRQGRQCAPPVVICRVTSKFASAAFPGVYFNRDCPCSLHTDAAAFAGSAEPERRGR